MRRNSIVAKLVTVVMLVMTIQSVCAIPVSASQSNPFKDVSEDKYYYAPVSWAYENDITQGTSLTMFSPDRYVNRGQMITLVYRYYVSQANSTDEKYDTDHVSVSYPFKDVRSDKFYAPAVAWAYRNSITNGTSANTFSPDKPVTRGQMMAFLFRAAVKFSGVSEDSVIADSGFPDATGTFAKAIAWGAQNGITGGYTDGRFGTTDPCKRADGVTFLYRFYLFSEKMDALKDTDNDLLIDTDEKAVGTDPDNPDTDGDGFTDYEEVCLNTDPLTANEYDVDRDTDGDGLTDADEVRKYNSDPFNEDTDDDRLTDAMEVVSYGTDPTNEDTDGDTLTDGFEIEHALDPLKQSTDGRMSDSEVKIDQTIDEKSISLSLKDDSNVAVPTISGETNGELSREVFLSGATDSSAIENRAVVGKAVTVNGENDYINGLTLGFHLNNYQGDPSHLCIARVNDDGNYEPVESTSDGTNLSGRISQGGTYLVLDTEEFLSALGIDLDDLDDRKEMEKTDDVTLLGDNTEMQDQNNDAEGSVKAEIDREQLLALNQTNAGVLSAGVSGQADIVFAIDTTGSMDDTINNVVTNVTSFVTVLLQNYHVQANFALVDFKDIEEDGTDSTIVVKNGSSNWFSDADCFAEKVNELTASGGGDEPESDLDGLETARMLDFRDSADKFIILITDASYKTANNYGITSLDEEIEKLKAGGMNVSVVTNDENRECYSSLYEQTGGIYANIDSSSFSTSLLQLADLIGQNTSDGKWMILKHGYRYVKLTDEADQDGDGIATQDELGTEETIDLTNWVKNGLMSRGKNFDEYQGKTSVTVYHALSDPTREDTDGDGIEDTHDDAEWKKGYSDGSVGSLKMLAVTGDGIFTIAKDYLFGRANTGHSFLIYQSYVNDELDLSSWNGGYKANAGSWVGALAQHDPVSNYKLDADDVISFSAGGNEDFSAACAIYNMEFYKHMNSPFYSYKPNRYLTEKVTQSQLDKMMNVMDEESAKAYKAATHNCTHVSLNVWNEMYGTDIDPIGLNTPRNLYGWMGKNGAESDFDLDTIIS